MLAGDVEDWSGPVHQERLTQHTGLPASVFEEKKDANTTNSNTKTEDSTKDENKLEAGQASVDNENSESHAEKDGSDDEDEWKVKSLADYIPEGQFLYLPPSR